MSHDTTGDESLLLDTPATGQDESGPSSWVRQPDGSWRREATVATPVLMRLFEILVAGSVLLLSAPILLLIGMLIRLTTPGPALYIANRVGLNGKPFRFYKFRTQFIDSRERFPELGSFEFDPDKVDDVHLQIENDPRVTPVGRFLRKTSLDELPNFWSVLTGDLALVGPRPELWGMARYYDSSNLDKFSVRPGITGLAQVSGRGLLSFKETNDLDLEYVRERSWWLDMAILWKTVWQTVARKGAM